jgi:hypothetical protein
MEVAMSGQAEAKPPLPAARKSKNWTAAVVALLLLPLALPYPFYLLARCGYPPAEEAL